MLDLLETWQVGVVSQIHDSGDLEKECDQGSWIDHAFQDRFVLLLLCDPYHRSFDVTYMLALLPHPEVRGFIHEESCP